MEGTRLPDWVYNPHSYRLDAKNIAPLFGVSLRELAGMLEANANTVRTRPDSPGLQGALKEAVLAYRALAEMMPWDETIARWMRHPLPSLDGLTPIELAEQHGIVALRELAQSMLSGSYQ